MPYSDKPPPMVVPNSHEGMRYVNREVQDIVPFEMCWQYLKGRDHELNSYDDLFRPTDVPVCKNRSRLGTRTHNWCFRCVAGYPSVYLSEKDRASERDAAITFL